MQSNQICIIIYLLLAATTISPEECGAKTYLNGMVPSTREEKSQGLTVLVDINEKTLFVVSDNVVVKEHPIASGKYNSPSPLGDFQIIEKFKSDKEF